MEDGDILGHENMGEMMEVGREVRNLKIGDMAAENAQIETGSTVAIWGGGPVGQLTAQCALMLGAGRVILIERVPERLELARAKSKVETINFDEVESVYDQLMEMTRGRGPDSCIDAVGAEAHGAGTFDAVLDKAKAAVKLGTDRPHVLREAIMCCLTRPFEISRTVASRWC